jgi:hypothetical protein
MLEGQQNSWKAAAEVLEPHLDTGGLWAPLTDIVTVGSTVTSFVVADGVSLDADREWLLLLSAVISSGVSKAARLGPRGTFVNANYASKVIGDGVAETPAASQLRFGGAGTTPTWYGASVHLTKRGGAMRYWGKGIYTSTGSPAVYTFGGNDFNTSDIPRLDVSMTASSSILAGTEAQLFRRIA